MSTFRSVLACSLAAALLPSAAPAAEQLPLGAREIVRKHQLAARQERERFRKQIRDIEERLIRDLKREEADLKRRGAAADAVRTSELVQRLEQAGIETNLMSRGHILGSNLDDALLSSNGVEVPVSSRKEFGEPVGDLPKGSRLVLQYVTGSWKHNFNVASAIPDDPKESAANRLCIAVHDPASNVVRVLAVVPPNTKQTPFVWTVPENLTNVILRINDDDSDFLSNPDKGVKYRVRVEID